MTVTHKLITNELLQMCLKSQDFMQLANIIPGIFTTINKNKNYIAFYILQYYKFNCNFILAYNWYATFVKYNICMSRSRTWLRFRVLRYPNFVPLLWHDKSSYKYAALHKSCLNNDVQRVKHLLQQNNVCPIQRDNFALPAALLHNNFNLAILLCTYTITELSCGTDLQTVLQYAVSVGCCPVVCMLLKFTHLDPGINDNAMLLCAQQQHYSHIESMLLCDSRVTSCLHIMPQ